MSFQPYTTILVKPAAALVPFSPYQLSNSTVGDVPTATICGVNGTPHIFVGAGPTQQSGAGVNSSPGTFYNATPGKKPDDAFVAGDTFAIQLQGYPIARLRASGALTEGAQVALRANGQVGTPADTDQKIVGVTLGAAAGANSEVDVLIQVVANPSFVPT